MIARKTQLDRLALGMFEQDSKILEVARIVSDVTGCPVLGGVAVFLHGYQRTTADVDLLTADTDAARAALEAAGAVWDPARREFILDTVPIHLVTTSQTGSEASHTSRIEGVLTVGLADLIRFKLNSGLNRIERAQDLADVVELVRRVPLDKSFASKLPKDMRDAFAEIADAVHPENPADG